MFEPHSGHFGPLGPLKKSVSVCSNEATRISIVVVTTVPIVRFGVFDLGCFLQFIDQFLKFGGAHRNGRLCCKLFKGGDIGLIYELLFHWRTIFKKELGRVKCALVITYSHLTLNNTGEGWEVRLPSNHTLTEGEEDQR